MIEYVTKEEYDKLLQRLEALENAFYKDNFIAEQIFTKNITFKGDVNFRNNKLGFFSATPIVQKDHITDPTGSGSAGVDSPARSAINSILIVLESFGLIKSS